MNIRLQNCIEILQYAIEHKISLTAACIKKQKGKNYFSNFLRVIEERKKNGQISDENYDDFLELYNQFNKKTTQNNHHSPLTSKITFHSPTAMTISNFFTESELKNNLDNVLDTQPLTKEEQEDILYNAELDDAYDERSFGTSVRDENKKIKHYHFRILIREQQPLEGTFSREEMDKVYRLYSNMDGAGLNLRAVSREFNNLSYRDFKRIIRAFNITKQSIPVAPHILEENSEDVITEYVLRNKENNVLKKLESEKGKFLEKNLIEARKQIIQMRCVEDFIQGIVEKYIERKDDGLSSIAQSYTSKPIINGTGKSTICAFGDIHYGKLFDGAIYGRGYNKVIAHERVMNIANKVIADYKIRNPKEINLICVGDLVESVMEDGMHPGHTKQMDLFQEDQLFYAVDSLKLMIAHIAKNVDCPIVFHSIHGNHDRIGVGRDDDKSRTAGKIISIILQRELESDKVRFNIPKNNLLRLVIGKLCLFVQHGDSSLSKKKPSELINLHGEPGCYSVLLQGHWHTLKTEEGTNYVSIKMPSVASTDDYIMNNLGNNNLAGFILGCEPEDCYGFDYGKVTLR